MDHPTDESLLGALLAPSAAPKRAELEAARTSPELARRIGRLQAMLRSLESAPSLDPLFEVEAPRLNRVASQTLPRAALAPLAQALREVVAQLVSRATPGPRPALRPGAPAGDESRRLLFRAEDLEIDLRPARVRPSLPTGYAGEVHLIGRLTGASGPVDVALRDPDGAWLRATTDADGFFEFRTRPGEHRLEVALSDRVVVVPVVELTQPA